MCINSFPWVFSFKRVCYDYHCCSAFLLIMTDTSFSKWAKLGTRRHRSSGKTMCGTQFLETLVIIQINISNVMRYNQQIICICMWLIIFRKLKLHPSLAFIVFRYHLGMLLHQYIKYLINLLEMNILLYIYWLSVIKAQENNLGLSGCEYYISSRSSFSPPD